MKFKGCFFRLEKERNRELRSIFNHLFFDEGLNIFQISEKIAVMPSKRFWVDENRAAIVVSRMEKGDSLPNMLEMKRKMYQEIYRRTQLLRVEYKGEKTTKDLVSEVIQQPAPLFYLKKKTIEKTLYRILNGWYEKRITDGQGQ